jgi:D-3-phosphoglycerate dehydrogenase
MNAGATSFPKNQIKIVLLENVAQTAVDSFKAQGFQVEHIKTSLPKEELKKKIADAHVLGIRSKTNLTPEIFSEARRLLSVGCFCIGTNQVALKDAELRGIPVFNAPFSNTRSVAELVISEIVMLSRQLGDRVMEMHKGTWKKVAAQCHEVRGKTLGIVGYGHIGSQVSVLAEAMGMRVVFFDVVTKMPLGNGRPAATLKELLAESDFVTLHVPETPQTMNMMGAAELAAMKKGAHLLNNARGTVVDIEALASALRSGQLGGAAVDVYPEEPEANGEGFKTALQGIPNVILTPHIGGSTEEAQSAIGGEVATSLVKYINTGATGGSVNFPQVDLPPAPGKHRILNVHRNVPGVLRDINKAVSDAHGNIHAQVLSTDSDIGYLVMDLDHDVSEEVKKAISALQSNIRTRILY